MQMCPACSHNNPDTAQFCARCQTPLRNLLGRHTLLGGRYIVARVLGYGGMGAVYFAEDRRIAGRKVAVKESFAAPFQAQQQTQHEAALMVNLRHPGLPNISDQFTDRNGRQYLVMDFIDGGTLEDEIQRRGALPEAEALTLAGRLLDVLVYLHKRGIVHRDIKPANIKLPPESAPALVDFGISKLNADGTRTFTQGAGSPGFAPPEQYGAGPGTDPRSDIYSLGAVIYFTLTGQSPPPSPDIAAGAPLTPPRKLRPALSPHTQRLVFKAMALDPATRYQSAAEMQTALQKQSAGQQSAAAGFWASATKTEKGAIIAIAGVILLTLAAIIALCSFQPAPKPGRACATPTIAASTSAPTKGASAAPASGGSTPRPVATFTPISTATPTKSAATALPPAPFATSTSPAAATPTPTYYAARPQQPTPTRSIPHSAPPVLLNPNGDTAQKGIPIQFSWRWDGELQENQQFEILIWRPGSDHSGAYDVREMGKILRREGNVWSASIDVDAAAGVSGEGPYNWSVALAQIEPYRRIGPEAAPLPLTYVIPGPDEPPPKPTLPTSEPPPPPGN